jgi:DNA-binding beta-propeller fold protein YncE
MVIAGVARKGLYATTDGKTWRELGAGAGSDTIINRPSSIVFDPEHPEVFWESGIYNGGGVYVTKDNGETFSQLGNITHNDLVSIDFTDPERKTLLAGGHEQKRTLHHSTDAGQTWTNIGDRLPEDSHFSTAPLIIDTNVYLVGACGWGDGACGVFRSTDGGASFVKASALGATNAPLLASDGFIYYPLIWDNGIALSKNQGETWLKPVGYGVVKTVRPVELPDGRILSVGERSLMLATAGGGAFRAVGEPLPFASPAGLAYSAATKTVYIWRNDCGNKVLPNAIMSAGFDYSVE